MFDDVSDKSLAEICSKFQNHISKLHNDIEKTYKDDDKAHRKILEKELKVSVAVLSNILKLRNLIAQKET